MQITHKEKLKVAASSLLFLVAMLVFYKVFLQSFWMSRVQQPSIGDGPRVQMVPSENAPRDTAKSLSDVAEEIKTVLKEKLSKSTDDRVYVFTSAYDYSYNVDKKSPAVISKEIKDLVAGNECDSRSGYANCSVVKKSHEYEFGYMLSRSYAYYLIPASLGHVPYDDVFRGFKVNNFPSNAWLEKQIKFTAEDGQVKDYLLYIFPSGNRRDLDGPLTGPVNVISP